MNTMSSNFRDWKTGKNYKIIKQIGIGSYGSVVKAKNIKTGKNVAIKRIKNLFDDLIDGKRVLREICLLKKLNHPNIINLLDIVIPDDMKNFNEIYLILEYAPGDLKKLFKSSYHLELNHIVMMTYNILVGLKFIHSAGVWHRDLKPANVLIFDDGRTKICDFGLARSVENKKNNKQNIPPKKGLKNIPKNLQNIPKSSKFKKKKKLKKQKKLKNVLTSHVVTRWYRAPELILIEKNYSSKIDVWSLGCIFAELLLMIQKHAETPLDRSPLFPGTSCFPLSPDSNAKIIKCGFPVSVMDQLIVIIKTLGFPNEEDLSFVSDVKAREYIDCLPKKKGVDFGEIFCEAGELGLDFLKKCLEFNPEKRIGIDEAIEHPLFEDCRERDKEMVIEEKIFFEFEQMEIVGVEDLRQLFLKEIYGK